MTFGREAEQYLCAAVLRSGKAVASEGAVALLSRLLPLLRCAFPRARFLVRLDAGFATPEVFDSLDACPRLDYVISIPKNAVLLRHAEPAMTRARARSARSGRTEHVYGETRYAAGSWKQQRRVVIKAEVVRLAGREPRDNPRFVVTNLGRPPRSLYEKVYCARGDIENRIKELLDGLQIDRTSCCRFAANQLRVLLTAAALGPGQELPLVCGRHPDCKALLGFLRSALGLPAFCCHRYSSGTGGQRRIRGAVALEEEASLPDGPVHAVRCCRVSGLIIRGWPWSRNGFGVGIRHPARGHRPTLAREGDAWPPGSAPTVKQHLAAIRALRDSLVVHQVLPVNRPRRCGAEARRDEECDVGAHAGRDAGAPRAGGRSGAGPCWR